MDWQFYYEFKAILGSHFPSTDLKEFVEMVLGTNLDDDEFDSEHTVECLRREWPRHLAAMHANHYLDLYKDRNDAR